MSNEISGLSAGWRTTCGLFNEQLQCFGWNQYGQIGVGTSGDQYLPVPVTTNLPTVDFVAPGVVHTCVVTKDSRRLYCWGSNDSVDLLLEDPIVYSSPQSVSVGGRIRQLTSGRSHICAVVDMGESDQFVCWGGNEYGQLGVNSNLPFDDPIEVQLSVLPKQISAGYLHQCAILSTDNSLWYVLFVCL
jgi:alpha-tubulin suppressor-like RCC1 family protein